MNGSKKINYVVNLESLSQNVLDDISAVLMDAVDEGELEARSILACIRALDMKRSFGWSDSQISHAWPTVPWEVAPFAFVCVTCGFNTSSCICPPCEFCGKNVCSCI